MAAASTVRMMGVRRRAGGLHSRTIEVLDQRGIADRFLARGQVVQMEETSTRPRDRPGGDSWSLPTLRPSILLAGVNHVMTRFDHGVPAAANPECNHVSSMSWRGVSGLSESATCRLTVDASAHASRSSRIQGVSAPMVVDAPWPGRTIVDSGSSATRRRMVAFISA
jgi:hypothetical protein